MKNWLPRVIRCCAERHREREYGEKTIHCAGDLTLGQSLLRVTVKRRGAKRRDKLAYNLAVLDPGEQPCQRAAGERAGFNRSRTKNSADQPD